MPDPMKPEFTAQNPIVAAAERIRARRELGRAIDGGGEGTGTFDDAEAALRGFGRNLAQACTRLNAIIGRSAGARYILLERPLRLRLRMGEKRLGLDLDDVNQLVRISGLDLDGDYQFVPGAPVPALINVSVVSNVEGYGDALTASALVKLIAQDAELPRPSHLDQSGPISF
ncbi:MAG TPA: hypothetical protein VIJ12_11425 [Candidatus Baltobacteraceae bacterium]